MSILEAMAMGKPVIATRVGGIPTIVKPGINGWLVNPGDVNALAGILQEIIQYPALLSQYGNQSLSMVKDYSATHVVERLNTLYENLLKGASVSKRITLYEEIK
jgi:glycosyltransferase involved in cell wall biosynthesis